MKANETEETVHDIPNGLSKWMAERGFGAIRKRQISMSYEEQEAVENHDRIPFEGTRYMKKNARLI